MVAAAVGLGGGRSGATLTERAASGAGEEMAERGEWPVGGLVLGALSLSLSFLSEGNGNEWAVGKSEMRKSGRWLAMGKRRKRLWLKWGSLVLQGKNGDGGLTERGAAAFWRRDGDGGTAKRGMGILVKGRGHSVWPERD